MSLCAKRLERDRFPWPSPADGIIAISAAQLAYILDGIDWETRFARDVRRPPAEGRDALTHPVVERRPSLDNMG